MEKASGVLKFLSGSVTLTLGKYQVPFVYWQIAAIIVLIFLLVVTMAQYRRHQVDWSLKGAVFGVFFGFLLALILEGFLIIGGKTAITEILGWKNAPKPLTHAIEAGRSKLVNVLGVQDEIPGAYAQEEPTATEAIEILQILPPADMQKVKNLICAP
jgi:cytochrome b561